MMYNIDERSHFQEHHVVIPKTSFQFAFVRITALHLTTSSQHSINPY